MKKLFFVLSFFPLLGFCQLHNYEMYMPSSTDNLVYHKSFYSHSYLKDKKLSEWTIYFTSNDMKFGEVLRTDRFHSDPSIESKFSAVLSDYRGSGYDRGHLVPAADMSFDYTAMNESFLMTNIAPQKPEFNRGIWLRIENNVRELRMKYDSLIIITGCFFTDSTYNYPQKIGNVSVPAFYYKVIADIEESRAFCFIVPNDPKDEKGEDYGEIDEYIYSVDQLENLTNIDFFYKLPKYQQELLEE